MEKMLVLGLMSGTSLDGLDMALVEFSKDNAYHFNLIDFKTFPYSKKWENQLRLANTLSGLDLQLLHLEFGGLCGGYVNQFLEGKPTPDLIGSHGHTVFHEPSRNLTYQIGCGQQIATISGINTIADFRKQDVLKGGQGAPLVPIGDRLLFADYAVCINLGGFANLSYEEAGERIAFDICPFNMGFNRLAQKLDLPFDKDGALSKQGTLQQDRLDALNAIRYYKMAAPKSIGKEWFDKQVWPLLDDLEPLDALNTYCQHVCHQIIQILKKQPKNAKVLLTGGGVYHQTSIQQIEAALSLDFIIPPKQMINSKEALIFAFLAYLRQQNEVNVLASVTGANTDHSSGVLFLP